MTERRATPHALPVALSALILLQGPLLSAQILGGAAYLQSDHVEVGISACGAYGTAFAPPSVGAEGVAYHPTETGLGFVADGAGDGWADGFPPYCGDYFLPGSPVEGFALSIGGTDYANHSGYGICGVEDIPGSIVDYGFGDTVFGTWEGVHPDGFRLRIRTYIPDGKRYFIGEVVLENQTSTEMKDIYFSRQVDPDNDQAWGGGFQTTNRIARQPGPGQTDALATAEGSMGCFIGIGARHFASRASRGGFYITNARDPYCGEVPYTHSGTELADDAIAVNFFFARLEAGESLSFSYAYILDAGQLEEALNATSAPMLLADGLPMEAEVPGAMPELGLCMGDSVFLEVQGGANFSWDWNHHGDFQPISATAGWLRPSASGSYSVSTSVACGSDIAFSFDVELGNPSAVVFVEPVADLCPGSELQLASGNLPDGSSVQWHPSRWLDQADRLDAVLRPDTVQAELTYVLQVSDHLGCSLEQELQITVHPQASVDAGADKVGVIGQRVYLDGSGAESYSWSPASYLDHAHRAKPSAIVTDTVLFTLTGTDANGCTATDQVWVFGTPDRRMVLPNAFSPDGDGLNDCFGVGPSFHGRFIDLRIFSRWGALVFQSADDSACWDGTLSGKPQPMGAYTVQFRYVDSDGVEQVSGSSLTLIR
jgi:gliding motility-associated-like protein